MSAGYRLRVRVISAASSALRIRVAIRPPIHNPPSQEYFSYVLPKMRYSALAREPSHCSPSCSLISSLPDSTLRLRFTCNHRLARR